MTRVGVVGGGSTGAGIARDLALRGVEVVLFDKGGLSSGATGHAHGLLHSGARYADRDVESARECIEENRVVREIAPNCVEETDGLFVELNDGTPKDYFDEKLRACEECGIPTRTVEDLHDDRPYLAPDARRGFEVPDAVVDGPRLVAANSLGATRKGARVLTDSEVTDVITTDGGRVEGVEYTDGENGRATVEVDHVVNAAGAWADRVAGMVGVDVGVRPSKGAMVAFGYEVGTVLNRCRPSDNGDIVVPHGPHAVVGTTDEEVENPDDYEREDREVELMRREGSRMVPALEDADAAYTYWGVRPLYDPTASDGTVEASRGFVVLDHAERDGVRGFTSVVGGKLTTYRLMAEETADVVCDALGVSAGCETARRPLPDDDEELEGRMAEWGVTATPLHGSDDGGLRE